VINIVTRGGAAKPLQVDLGASYFSGSEGWQAWGAVSGRSGALDYRLSGGADAHGDRRVAHGPYSEGARLDRTSYDNDNVSAHLGWRFGDGGKHYLALKADQHRLSTESWTDPASLSETTRSFVIDLPKRDLRKLGLYYDAADLSPTVAKVHVDLYHQSVERLFLNEVVTAPGMFPGTITVASTSDDRNDNWGGTVQLDLRLHPEHYTIVGLQHLTDDLRTAKTSRRTSTVPMVPGSFSESLDEASIRTSSAFAQDEWFLGEAFKLSAGARYYHTRTSLDHTSDPLRADYAGRSDGRVVGAAGLSYSGLKDTTLRLHYGEGYITPTLLQLFTDTTPAGQMLYANPALKPETSRNLEFGLRHQRGALALDATAFYTRAKDYITTVACSASPVPCPSHGRLPVRTIHVNANQARSFGVELEAEARLPATAAVQLTPYVSAAWMRRELEFGDFATYHSDTPALAGRIGLRGEGRIAQRKLWGDLFLRAASATRQQEAAGVEPSRLPGYATLNLGLGGAFGEGDRVQYALALNNLLDKSYRSSFSEIPATGRSLELTLRTSF
jgi:hemoglobin/transferrin/lactoferrin receptor protein